MTLTSLSLNDIVVNTSNSFVGFLSDLYRPDPSDDTYGTDGDRALRLLLKENRHMYLALLLIFVLLLAKILF